MYSKLKCVMPNRFDGRHARARDGRPWSLCYVYACFSFVFCLVSFSTLSVRRVFLFAWYCVRYCFVAVLRHFFGVESLPCSAYCGDIIA